MPEPIVKKVSFTIEFEISIGDTEATETVRLGSEVIRSHTEQYDEDLTREKILQCIDNSTFEIEVINHLKANIL